MLNEKDAVLTKKGLMMIITDVMDDEYGIAVLSPEKGVIERIADKEDVDSRIVSRLSAKQVHKIADFVGAENSLMGTSMALEYEGGFLDDLVEQALSEPIRIMEESDLIMVNDEIYYVEDVGDRVTIVSVMDETTSDYTHKWIHRNVQAHLPKNSVLNIAAQFPSEDVADVMIMELYTLSVLRGKGVYIE